MAKSVEAYYEWLGTKHVPYRIMDKLRDDAYLGDSYSYMRCYHDWRHGISTEIEFAQACITIITEHEYALNNA